MNFFHRAFASRSKNGGKSWHPLWKLVPFLVFAVLFFGFRAVNQNDAASNQQTSFGIIGQCEHRGRGGIDIYCDYTFPVGDEQYTGVNQADSELRFGQAVVVYYDYQKPGVNALEDFTEQSRKSRRFVCILLLVLAAVVAYILLDGAPTRETSDKQPTP
jgi:hypothetical protein